MQSKVIFLMGPTAAGKTDLAIQLAPNFPIDIISVDSAMIYRGMEIGTGKPSKDILQNVPHKLIDICDPTESYSAAQFRQDALTAIKNSLLHQRIPLLVGGSMLYFNALSKGLANLPEADEEIRNRLQTQLAEKGLHEMHQRLQKIDSNAALRIHPNDPQRIIRALEVYEITGKSLTAHFNQQAKETFPYSVLQIAIAPTQREQLHERIALRFQAMLNQGLVEEVKLLREKFTLTANFPSMRTVGYRQVCQYLENQLSYTEMQDRGVVATRQLAKRQLTWLRHWENLCWFASDDEKLLQKVITAIYTFTS